MTITYSDNDITVASAGGATFSVAELAASARLATWPEEVLQALPPEDWTKPLVPVDGMQASLLYVAAVSKQLEDVPFLVRTALPIDSWMHNQREGDCTASPIYAAAKAGALGCVPTPVMSSLTPQFWLFSADGKPSILEVAIKANPLEDIFDPEDFIGQMGEIDDLWAGLKEVKGGARYQKDNQQSFDRLRGQAMEKTMAQRSPALDSGLDGLFGSAPAAEAPAEVSPSVPAAADRAAIQQLEAALRETRRSETGLKTEVAELKRQVDESDARQERSLRQMRSQLDAAVQQRDEAEGERDQARIERDESQATADDLRGKMKPLNEEVLTEKRRVLTYRMVCFIAVAGIVASYTVLRPAPQLVDNPAQIKVAQAANASAAARLKQARQLEQNISAVVYRNPSLPPELAPKLGSLTRHAAAQITGTAYEKPAGQKPGAYRMSYRQLAVGKAAYHTYSLALRDGAPAAYAPSAFLVRYLPTTAQEANSQRVAVTLCYATNDKAIPMKTSADAAACLNPQAGSAIESITSIFPVSSKVDREDVRRALVVAVKATLGLLDDRAKGRVRPLSGLHVAPARPVQPAAAVQAAPVKKL